MQNTRFITSVAVSRPRSRRASPIFASSSSRRFKARDIFARARLRARLVHAPASRRWLPSSLPTSARRTPQPTRVKRIIASVSLASSSSLKSPARASRQTFPSHRARSRDCARVVARVRPPPDRPRARAAKKLDASFAHRSPSPLRSPAPQSPQSSPLGSSRIPPAPRSSRAFAAPSSLAHLRLSQQTAGGTTENRRRRVRVQLRRRPRLRRRRRRLRALRLGADRRRSSRGRRSSRARRVRDRRARRQRGAGDGKHRRVSRPRSSGANASGARVCRARVGRARSLAIRAAREIRRGSVVWCAVRDGFC